MCAACKLGRCAGKYQDDRQERDELVAFVVGGSCQGVVPPWRHMVQRGGQPLREHRCHTAQGADPEGHELILDFRREQDVQGEDGEVDYEHAEDEATPVTERDRHANACQEPARAQHDDPGAERHRRHDAAERDELSPAHRAGGETRG
ncbi:hypothetical protein KEM60_02498 [Austwickia sp. TVS 96-490-7B]|nr:hypothetical protein [Austwickia sp. TVS 96-490-7B]